jgi:hypothetical protein
MTPALLAALLAATSQAPTAGAPPAGPVEAERAFALMAQTDGQWTAFRAFAAPDAVMFVPGEVNAQQWLAGREDPPVPVMWWPGAAWLSCDGRLAVTTGPWVRDGGRLRGFFTTVWQRQADGGWKWLLDHGDTLTEPRGAPDRPEVRRASCDPAAPAAEGSDGSLLWDVELAADGAREVVIRLWNGREHEVVVHDKVAAPKP